MKFTFLECAKILKRYCDLLGNNCFEGSELVLVCDVLESKARLLPEKFNVAFLTR